MVNLCVIFLFGKLLIVKFKIKKTIQPIQSQICVLLSGVIASTGDVISVNIHL